MKSYRYASPLTLTKQTLPANSPLPSQTNSHLILKATISDRSNLDYKPTYTSSLRNSLNHSILSKDVSLQLLNEFQSNNQNSSLAANSLKLGNDSERSSIDLQRANLSFKLEDEQLESSRADSMVTSNVFLHKMGEKIKTKTQLMKCSSKPMEINMENSLKLPNLRALDSTVESQKSERNKSEAIVEWVNLEISKLTDRMIKNEEKMEKIEKTCKKLQTTNVTESFINPQFEEINKILSLVEKAQNRDDYRKTMKMIDELRSNILQLHVQLKQVRIQKEGNVKKEVNCDREWEKVIKEECRNMGNNFQEEILKIGTKIEEIQRNHHLKLPLAQKEEHSSNSSQRFEGKMITFLYEERISLPNSPQLALQSPNKPKADALTDKQNNQTAILTSNLYHIDSEGYLLDRNRYYILNKNNEQIKLTPREMDLLRKHSILQRTN